MSRLKKCYIFSIIIGLIGVIIGSVFIVIGCHKNSQWQIEELQIPEMILRKTVVNLTDCEEVWNTTCYQYDLDIGFIFQSESVKTRGQSFECFNIKTDCQGVINQLQFQMVYFHEGNVGDWSYDAHKGSPYVKWINGGVIILVIGFFCLCFRYLSGFNERDCQGRESVSESLL
jgi:uncharacterized membrane protein